MSISLEKCKKEGGEIFDVEDTGRKVCLLPAKTKDTKRKAVLID